MDEVRVVDIVYLSFSEDFDAVSHNILSGKFGKWGLNEWAVIK